MDASASAYVSFKLKKSALVQLKLVDMNGVTKAEVWVNEMKSPGKYIVPIDKKALRISEGLYYYVLDIEGLPSKKKLITVR
jgi:hypothetical protein